MENNDKKKYVCSIFIRLIVFLLIMNIPLSLIGIPLEGIIFPLRRNEWGVRNYMLWVTPIGTDMDDVLKTVKRKKWQLGNVDRFEGFPINRSKNFRRDNDTYPEDREYMVGEKTITACVCEYRLLFIFDRVVQVCFRLFQKTVKLVLLNSKRIQLLPCIFVCIF